MTPTTIITRTGGTVDILNPDPNDIIPADIAEHLAKINRFAGATTVPYSVAQHCVLGSRAAPPELKGYFLLHDAHEYITGDPISPLKRALALISPTSAQALSDIQDNIDAAIHRAAALPWPINPREKHYIHQLDLRLLATERRDLTTNSVAGMSHETPDPLPQIITAWPWTSAADQWLDAARVHCPRLFNNIRTSKAS